MGYKCLAAHFFIRKQSKAANKQPSPSWYTEETVDHNTIATDIDTVKASNVNPARRVTVSEHQATFAPIANDDNPVLLLTAAHALIFLQLSPTQTMANGRGLEEDVQGYLDESDIELNEDETEVLIWLCIAVQRRPGRNSSFFVRQVAISVDTLRAEHAEGLYTLVTRDRGEDNEQEEHKSPSTISSKTSSSRSEVIPLDFSGLNLDEMPDPPQLFNDAGSSIVIAMESDSLATMDTADTTKSSGGQAAP